MYHLYHTPALVLGSSPVGEASRTILLFTRELGLVSARAMGARLLGAKLRYHLTDFSYIDAWLVRGKEMWRLANAVSRANFFSSLSQNPPPPPSFTKGGGGGGGFSAPIARAILARAALLLRRLLPPEEKHKKLFDAFVSCAALLQQKSHAPNELHDIEILLALRILFHLGYLGEPREFIALAESDHFGISELASIAPIRRRLVSVINSSLRVTGL